MNRMVPALLTSGLVLALAGCGGPASTSTVTVTRTATRTVTATPSASPSASGSAVPSDCVINMTNRRVVYDVRVPQGKTCVIRQVRIAGNVLVAEGATLSMTNVRVDGNVLANGHKSVSITGGRVDGNLELQDGAAVAIQRAMIDGNIRLMGNNGGTKIIANVVVGRIYCTRNDPAPTGSGNKATRGLTGQCEQL